MTVIWSCVFEQWSKVSVCKFRTFLWLPPVQQSALQYNYCGPLSTDVLDFWSLFFGWNNKFCTFSSIEPSIKYLIEILSSSLSPLEFSNTKMSKKKQTRARWTTTAHRDTIAIKINLLRHIQNIWAL